jgi:phthalate 4,5-cis-dihydrodiol dehydrogenase
MVTGRQVGLGVIGLGRAFTLMLPTFGCDKRFRLAAATTPGAEARAAFTAEFDAPTYDDVTALCRDPNVEAVYVASPHQFHAEHVELAARAGKHILVEKPLAITLAEGKAMVAAAKAAGVHMVVGPSHGFDAPILRAREIIASGEVGRLRMIQAMNYTDFLYRPRRPEELDSARGGGVVFSQAVHQVDVARLLGGGMVRTVRAMTGNWDPARPTEGAYSLMMDFEDGVFAALTYSGYGRFDSDEFMGWMGELGHRKDPADYGKARRALKATASAEDEAAMKRRRNYGQDGAGLSTTSPLPDANEHFGFAMASCERADLRPMPDGVMIYGDGEPRLDPLPPPVIPRAEVMDELHAAVVDNTPPLHSGAWGLATLEVCLAILQSAREGREVEMVLQVPAE